MKTPREKFEESYVAVSVPADNKNGFKIEYVYYDEWFMWKEPEERLKRTKCYFIALCLLKTALFLVSSTVYAGVNARLWVEVPATLAFCALIFEVIGAFQFRLAKYRTTRQSYNDIHLKLRTSPVIFGALILITAAISLGYMLTGDYSPASLAVTLGYAVCAVISAGEYKLYSGLKLKTEHNTNFDKYRDDIVKFKSEDKGEEL